MLSCVFSIFDSGGSECVRMCEYKNRELKSTFERIELPAKLLDYFLRSNKSNINQCLRTHTAHGELDVSPGVGARHLPRGARRIQMD